MPKQCKVALNQKVPKGYHKVAFERKGKLYIEVDNILVVLPNPFDNIPRYVKLYKNKSGEWHIRK